MLRLRLGETRAGHNQGVRILEPRFRRVEGCNPAVDVTARFYSSRRELTTRCREFRQVLGCSFLNHQCGQAWCCRSEWSWPGLIPARHGAYEGPKANSVRFDYPRISNFFLCIPEAFVRYGHYSSPAEVDGEAG